MIVRLLQIGKKYALACVGIWGNSFTAKKKINILAAHVTVITADMQKWVFFLNATEHGRIIECFYYGWCVFLCPRGAFEAIEA